MNEKILREVDYMGLLLRINEKLAKGQKMQIKFLLTIDSLHFCLMDDLTLLKARIWNAGVLLWWYRLWIRTNEFDKSLSFDDLAYRVMSKSRRR